MLANIKKRYELGFKILDFEVVNNRYLGNLKLSFSDEDMDVDNFPFSTVIIGSNGTGKSNILRTIINIFRELYSLKEHGKRGNDVSGKFEISYLLNGRKYAFGNTDYEEVDKRLGSQFIKHKVWALIDDQICEDINDMELPANIIASSMMITDKYPYLKKEAFPIYTYLGVRNSRASSGTRAYVRRTVDIIKDSLSKIDFKDKLKDILEYLELENSLTVSYSLKYKRIFIGQISQLTSFTINLPIKKNIFPREKPNYGGLITMSQSKKTVF